MANNKSKRFPTVAWFRNDATGEIISPNWTHAGCGGEILDPNDNTADSICNKCLVSGQLDVEIPDEVPRSEEINYILENVKEVNLIPREK